MSTRGTIMRGLRRRLAAVSALAMGAALAVALPAAPASAAAAAARVDNPYVGATAYVNPDWSAKAAAEPGGAAIANTPAFVWMDRIAAITGSSEARGLRAHLDTALAQGANLFQVVIYDLPGRDCAALASNGELGPTELGRYESEYIDPIAAILADPAYANLRIVTIIEPDSLPNIVTNAGGTAGSTDACATMKANGNYEKGVGYALHTLGAIPNVYNYIDAAHHGWLGWDSNMSPAAAEFKKAATSEGATVNDVTGFIVNTANYSALKEPNFKVTDSVNGTTVRQSKWVDWNYYVDELSFAQALRTLLVSQGFNSNIGMLIDTARNGWGGSARPTAAGPTTSVDAYVDGGRVDRRIHAGNWCNQSGAGIGERPTAAPETGIDAYVWAKPPGESDGNSAPVANDEGKGFDRMCDPTYTGNGRNGNSMTGALANSPLAGHWFSAQFQELVRNAYPPITGGGTGTDTTAPTAPTGLTSSAKTSSSVSLSWTASTDNTAVTGYDIFRAGVKVGSSTTTSYTDTGLTASTAYSYTVKAKDAAGNLSAASSALSVTTSASSGGTTDTTAPTAPTGLTSSAKTSSSVSLSWTASTDNTAVTGYDIFRAGVKVGSSTTTSYTDTGLTASTAYSYTVKAKDAAGNVSAASSALSVTTSASGGTGTGTVKVQYKSTDSSATDNQIRMSLQLVNTGSSAVNLSTVKLRYWFTPDGGASTFGTACDYAVVGCGTVTLGVTSAGSAAGASHYLEVGFGSGTLAAGASTGEIQLRINKSDWSNFSEADDYSRATNTSFADATKIGAYVGGTLAWGTAP
ncbi:glycoside hydrolase family 6 protein [Streptomyces sp. NBC_00102]|uniref:glycoside hydrolase family 6 protein n=1 Tax=Streptomyces sp. NBC_00102 TaxID=2975652 RepID=UPI002251A7D3|nr:glycoside hydrolase family 6 protein [Streptomyces sp. NBC_00102]MCX5395808.1 glycoside hydrolase family 6 protein [Streptomyces sp. NBC_00102]